MPNLTTKLGRYCIIHGYVHEDEYLECDFCNDHNRSVFFHERYYNYGFSKCYYHACNECHDTLFGPFKLGLVDNKIKAYESILEVIDDRTEKEGNETIDYYEAARITYTEEQYMRKYLDSEIDIAEINKWYKPIWEFTYRIVSGEDKERVRVVNKNPDNLLVQWVPGGMTMTEILKEMNTSIPTT